MRSARVLLLPLLALAAGCWQYRAGYCDQTHNDCGNGTHCDTSTNMCVQNGSGGSGGSGGIAGMGGLGGIGGIGGSDAGGAAGGRDGGVDKPAPCSLDANSCGVDKPICGSDGQCRACTNDPDCNVITGRPACLTSGTGAGRCVECTADTHCKSPMAPVCDTATNRCRPCGSDDDCKAFLPGVCTSVLTTSSDGGPPSGRCIAADEAIYVKKTGTCSDTVTAQTDAATTDAGIQGEQSDRPFCSMNPIRSVLSPKRHVVVVSGEVSGPGWSYNDEAAGPLLIVGKSATLDGAASPAFQMTAGNVTIRNVSFKTVSGVGIEADGGTLRLDDVKVDHCGGGGILLAGAMFDIRNTTVSNDGPGQTGAVSWGGIYVSTTPPPGSLANLDHVTISIDPPVGIACAGSITGNAVAVSNQSGGVGIQSSCMVNACAPNDAGTCGAPM